MCEPASRVAEYTDTVAGTQVRIWQAPRVRSQFVPQYRARHHAVALSNDAISGHRTLPLLP